MATTRYSDSRILATLSKPRFLVSFLPPFSLCLLGTFSGLDRTDYKVLAIAAAQVQTLVGFDCVSGRNCGPVWLDGVPSERVC